jgi:hypothetical protein
VSTNPTPDPIRVEFPEPFHPGWNKIQGVTVEGNTITIVPAEYFYRYEAPGWVVCDWPAVRDNLLDANETDVTSIEQMALDHIRAHGRRTEDPAEVLRIAWDVNAHMFRDDLATDPGLVKLGVTPEHCRMLREVSTVMALNRVMMSGRIANVGPAWMFPETCRVVYGLDSDGAALVDELYHGAWFNESRRVEAIKCNVALGGKLVHGCQSQADMRGGCVVPYGTDLEEFRRELSAFGDDWIARVARTENSGR